MTVERLEVGMGGEEDAKMGRKGENKRRIFAGFILDVFFYEAGMASNQRLGVKISVRTRVILKPIPNAS